MEMERNSTQLDQDASSVLVFWNSPDEAKFPPKVAAAVLGLSEHTLQNMRVAGNGPRFFKRSSRLVYYRKKDITAWLDESESMASTSDRH